MVAWIALVVSLLALAWNIASTLLKWPRLSTLTAVRRNLFVGTANVPAPPTQHRLQVIAINDGGEATTITDAGLLVKGNATVRAAYLGAEKFEGPPLPARIEAHGSLMWTFPDELTANTPEGAELVAFVERWNRRGSERRKRYVAAGGVKRE